MISRFRFGLVVRQFTYDRAFQNNLAWRPLVRSQVIKKASVTSIRTLGWTSFIFVCFQKRTLTHRNLPWY